MVETEKLPMSSQNYFVHMLMNDDRHTVLYVGATNKNESLIAGRNPDWRDLFADLYSFQP